MIDKTERAAMVSYRDFPERLDEAALAPGKQHISVDANLLAELDERAKTALLEGKPVLLSPFEVLALVTTLKAERLVHFSGGESAEFPFTLGE